MHLVVPTLDRTGFVCPPFVVSWTSSFVSPKKAAISFPQMPYTVMMIAVKVVRLNFEEGLFFQ